MRKSLLLLFLALIITPDLSGSFEFGKRMYEDGYLQEAKVVLERIISTSPTSSEAEESYLLLAEIGEKEEDYSKAENYYRVLYETFPSGKHRETALFRLGSNQYQQEKYSQALEVFNRFIQNFPTSSRQKDAYHWLLSAHYNLNNHNRVLTISRDFIAANPDNERVPDILFILAKSYIHLQNFNDGRNTLELIVQRYPASDARWESVVYLSSLIEQQSGLKQAQEELTKHLRERNIPRHYEEILRRELFRSYLADGQKNKAYEQLQELIAKFDRSKHLAEYLYRLSTIQLDAGSYQEIMKNYDRFKKDVYDTNYYYDFLVSVLEAKFSSGKTDEAAAIIDAVKDYAAEGGRPYISDNEYAVDFWQAMIKERNGFLLEAISDYQVLLMKVPVDRVRRYEIMMRIGDIYNENLAMYASAINFYTQVASGIHSTDQQRSLSLYRMAVCYDAIGDYDNAILSLNQINTEHLADDNIERQVGNKMELLLRFKRIDYEASTSRLLFSLIDYLHDDDKEKLKEELINVALYNLKDAGSVLKLYQNDRSPQALYIKAKAYLQQINQAFLENRSFRGPAQSLENVIQQLQEHQDAIVNRRIRELQIELRYARSNFSLEPETINDIESYLANYPGGEAVNRFSFLAGSYYLQKNIYVKADEYLQNVQLGADISHTEYEDVITGIAGYFSVNGQHQKAIQYYQALKDKTGKPEDRYRYAVSLLDTGNTSQGIQILELLVRNRVNFDGINDAVNLLASHYRAQSDYIQVVGIMNLLPDNRRDNRYYTTISDDYLQLGDTQKAKESLMMIAEKDGKILRNLARLHFKTGDVIMAEISYQELINKEPEQQYLDESYAMLGHIYYLQEDWVKAIYNYEKVFAKLNEKSRLADLSAVQIAKELSISLYRQRNRPRAEDVVKKFKKSIDDSPAFKSEIELNEAIYQMNVNRNRAERSFRDIIRNNDYPNEVRYAAHFWRGVNYLETNKVNDAFHDFQEAVKTTDRHLKNEAMLKLGTISFSKEQYQQALDYYYEVITNDATGKLAVDAAKNFAIVCKTINEWQKAIEAYNIILERGGEGELEGETIFNIAFCKYRDRRYSDAIPMFEQSIALLNDREMKAEAQYWIGENYMSLGHYEQAAAEFLKVGYYYPDLTQWSAVSEIKLSEIYVRQGRVDAARGVLEKVISRYGRNSDWGRQALAVLEQL